MNWSIHETMFVSRSFARRIFGDESPIGKTLLYNRTLPMTIKGVYEDIPENSSLYHEVVISFSTIEKHHWECMGWECGDSFQGYIRLKNASDLDKVNSRIDPIIEKHLPFRPRRGICHTLFITTYSWSSCQRSCHTKDGDDYVTVRIGDSFYRCHELCANLYLFTCPTCQSNRRT
ncbi:ABC transporter permease [Bacteroides fragilis]|nr:ABC transporter permease [Bacteroides fragilis]